MQQRHGAFGSVGGGARRDGFDPAVSARHIAVQLGLDIHAKMSHNVERMAKGDTLGEFELLILAALLMLGDNAYGMTIHEQTEKLAAGLRTVSLGSVYTTLDRLEQKGYVKSWFADPTPERGGRSKRFFEITGSGELAVKKSAKLAGNVLKGLREIGGLV